MRIARSYRPYLKLTDIEERTLFLEPLLAYPPPRHHGSLECPREHVVFDVVREVRAHIPLGGAESLGPPQDALYLWRRVGGWYIDCLQRARHFICGSWGSVTDVLQALFRLFIPLHRLGFFLQILCQW